MGLSEADEIPEPPNERHGDYLDGREPHEHLKVLNSSGFQNSLLRNKNFLLDNRWMNFAIQL